MANSSQSTFCRRCGCENNQNYHYCGKCGAKLSIGGILRPISLTPPERKEITVLFCDLVGSTELSSSMDPEDYREVLGSYQQIFVDEVERVGGYIGQYLGDGILAYFGYPHTSEVDADRAITAGLGILERLKEFNILNRKMDSVSISCRIGAHTGLTVTGEIGHGFRKEIVSLGLTPNIAARLQELATPNTLVISDYTFKLTKLKLLTENLGKKVLKGLEKPMVVHRVIRKMQEYQTPELATNEYHGTTVGRERELQILQNRWNSTKNGQPSTIIICGEAGIGKSRLIETFRTKTKSDEYTWIVANCRPMENSSTFSALNSSLSILASFREEDTREQRFKKLCDFINYFLAGHDLKTSVFADLLGLTIPQLENILPIDPEKRKEVTLVALQDLIFAIACKKPTVLWVNDLHWADPSTLELLNRIIESEHDIPLLLVLSCRPSFQKMWKSPRIEYVELSPLADNEIQEIIRTISAGKALSNEVIAYICRKSMGIPLFAEEICSMLIEKNLLDVSNFHQLETTIPSTLNGLLMARLDQLGTAKELAQFCSVLGEEFNSSLLHAFIHDQGIAQEDNLKSLISCGLISEEQCNGTCMYKFKHSLNRDAAYSSLLRSKRIEYHSKVSDILLEGFTEICDSKPEVLAKHLTLAKQAKQAIRYWYQAGRRSLERFANEEAIMHFEAGLDLLATASDIEDTEGYELRILSGLGPALIAIRGYASHEVEEVYKRALSLTHEVRDNADHFLIVFCLGAYFITRGLSIQAMEIVDDLIRISHRNRDLSQICDAAFALGQNKLIHGEFVSAYSALTRARECLNLIDDAYTTVTAYGQNRASQVLINLAVVAGYLGYDGIAAEASAEGIKWARLSGPPFMVAASLFFSAWQSQISCDVNRVLELSEEILSMESQFPFWSYPAFILHSWALVRTGRGKEINVDDLEIKISRNRKMGFNLLTAYLLGLTADCHKMEHRPHDGLRVISMAFNAMEYANERHCEAMLNRLRIDIQNAIQVNG